LKDFLVAVVDSSVERPLPNNILVAVLSLQTLLEVKKQKKRL
jgi:hypothetical protein